MATSRHGGPGAVYAASIQQPHLAHVVEHEELGNSGMPDHVRDDTDSGSGHRISLETASLALDLLAWMPMLALTAETRRWEPKKLRLGLCLLNLFCSKQERNWSACRCTTRFGSPRG